jgi:hypothetical protein
MVFLSTLLAYMGLALVLARGVNRESIVARRFGLGGGLATGAGWLLGIAPPTALKGWVFVPLLVALIGPGLAATIASHRFRDSRTGNLTALWSGLVAGYRFHRLDDCHVRERRRPLRQRSRERLPQERRARSHYLRHQRQPRKRIGSAPLDPHGCFRARKPRHPPPHRGTTQLNGRSSRPSRPQASFMNAGASRDVLQFIVSTRCHRGHAPQLLALGTCGLQGASRRPSRRSGST